MRKTEVKLSHELWLCYKEREYCLRNDFDSSDYSGFNESRIEIAFISLHRSEPKKRGLDYNNWEKVGLNFNPARKRKVWLVVARYTTGGTFGCTHGHWKVIAICEDSKTAHAKEELIRKGKLPKPKWKVGKKWYTGMHEWEGYFNSLDDVEVHILEIEK